MSADHIGLNSAQSLRHPARAGVWDAEPGTILLDIYLLPDDAPPLLEPGVAAAPLLVLVGGPEPLIVPLVDEPLVAPVDPASVFAPELPTNWPAIVSS